MRNISKVLFSVFLLFSIISNATCVSASTSQSNVSEPIYYVNPVDGKSSNYQNNYRIYKYFDGDSVKISKNLAHQLTVVNNTIYFMKIDSVEGQDGMYQRGTIWQVDTDGKNEKAVLDNTIFSLTSDGEYLYFVEPSRQINIMRMKPGGAPEIFLETNHANKLQYSNGWIYFVGDGIERVNINNKEVEKISDRYPDFGYNGYHYGINENYLIIFEYVYEERSTTVYKVNIDTKQEELFKDYDYDNSDYNFWDLQNGVLINYNWLENRTEFFNLNAIEAKDKQVSNQATLTLTSWYQMDSGHLVWYKMANNLKSGANERIIDTSRYALVLYSPDTSGTGLQAEIHFLTSESLQAGESFKDSFNTQFAGDYVVNGLLKSILVKFDSNKEIEDFKTQIPLIGSNDDMVLGKHVIDSGDQGRKWLADTFHITIK